MIELLLYVFFGVWLVTVSLMLAYLVTQIVVNRREQARRQEQKKMAMKKFPSMSNQVPVTPKEHLSPEVAALPLVEKDFKHCISSLPPQLVTKPYEVVVFDATGKPIEKFRTPAGFQYDRFAVLEHPDHAVLMRGGNGKGCFHVEVRTGYPVGEVVCTYVGGPIPNA